MGNSGSVKMFWSFVMAFIFCWLLSLCVPLRVCMRSLNALKMVPAGIIVGCAVYLCLKQVVSERQEGHVALTKMRRVHSCLGEVLI